MAWNEPGNKGNDPWGSGGGNKNQGPPDLDEVFRNLFSKFGGKKGGGGSQRPSIGGFGIGLVVIAAIVVWGLSGFYTIKEAERGVVLRFGQYIGEEGPGLHWKATFIDEVIPVNVSNVRSLPATGSMLTEDENVVRVEMEVQYVITDAHRFLFAVTDAHESLSGAMDSALRYVIGHNVMNDILTTGREKVRQDTWAELENIIAPYNMGLTIRDVNFKAARPPEEVKEAFDDAIAAQADEERFIKEAEAYAREREPKARGTVKRMEQEANAYKQRVILEAEGKVARFEKLLPEYSAAPKVTRDRLYIEAMAKVYGNTSKVLLDGGEGNGNMMYLPLDKMLSNQQRSMPVLPNANDFQQPLPDSAGQNSSPNSLSGRGMRGDRQGRN
ncbi:FtsH protease activity modulator HflK [Paraferrimonas sedimenticola]|uniref:Protein HflK n=1 Tax=Paraferrimonas sedimenticola TaxID=375674 RepID=A0AA37RW01_9GAMM|nr:FtsH protease activity modulator HflK [Paraferrimonas sedimenticola]GLP95737.1 protease modulator HflK [Paraferrimonas sedimenticola]